MRSNHNSPRQLDLCIEAIVRDLREQHELAKLLDGGPLRKATLKLLECSLFTYRLVNARRRGTKLDSGL